MEFYAGATDVATGKCVYHLCMDGGDKDMLWFRASASMPVVSRPVEIDGYEYLDGGISDAVPYAYMEQQGYDRNVHRIPKICEAMEHRYEMYNRQMEELDRMEAEETVLIIRPPEDLKIGHTEKNPEELERVYQIGRRETMCRLAEIQSWLKGAQMP